MNARAAAARLAHDVGKYVARTAHNLREGAPVPPRLVAMLARDLYALPAGRASSVFETLAAPLDVARDARLLAVRALLAEADALEIAVTEGRAEAVGRAAAIARAVEHTLVELARALSRSA